MPNRTIDRGPGPARPGAPLTTSEMARQLSARQQRARALRRATIRSRRRRNTLFGAMLLAATVLAGFGFSSHGASPTGAPAAGASTGEERAALPVLSPTIALSGETTGNRPGLAFPKMGESAVAFLGSGVVAESPRQKPVPIASLTKIMTAYLVLQAHPLVGNEQGPSLRFTAADHQAWIVASEKGNSNVELVKGERLTERQLLEALLIPSADNVADILGRWVSGSDKAFVKLMNQTARRLGLAHTRYADDSGVSPGSISTPGDQAYLASIMMENPVFRAIVALPDVAFPIMGHIWNYNPALGVDGIIGVKSGFTPKASGCLVTAAWHMVGGKKVLEVAAVTGQRFGLWQAAQADEALMRAASAKVRLVDPFGPGRSFGRLRASWEKKDLQVDLPNTIDFAGWGGLHYRARVVGAPLTRSELQHGWAAGQAVATLEVSDQFGPAFSMPLELRGALPPPPAGTLSRPAGAAVRVSH